MATQTWNKFRRYREGELVIHKCEAWRAKMDVIENFEPGRTSSLFWAKLPPINIPKSTKPVKPPVPGKEPSIERAAVAFQIKSVNETDRVISGIASTGTTDRMGDQVIPEGAKFSLPLPLLWQHDHSNPIGKVTRAKVTKTGIEVVCQIAKDVSPEIDRYWSLIKLGIVKGLSIGFRPLKQEPIPNSWGTKFTSWEWIELSAVSVPANAEATIDGVNQAAKHQTTRVVKLTEADKKAATRVVKLKPADRVVKLRRVG
ncbi:HK97 family phage prohead protease [Rhizobiaceae bacterium n13]|uniref:HK97 family phage prohead protease n=1 Tax=Ferirhizobium litorale TaxID=2927786 RepID=UPI0024B2E315|nr:HK97 family phage prohead protease [Fererhizobium litorale]MDI7865053.1 HK97 family phage prohead protease [Fererhizobium litorale]